MSERDIEGMVDGIVERYGRALSALGGETALDVERLRRAIHSECIRHWREITEVDPSRLITQHLDDAHQKYAEAIARAYTADLAAAREKGMEAIRLRREIGKVDPE